jgi:type IV secretion system protein TrbL
MEFNSLTTTLTHFITVFQGGYTRLQPVIHALLASLAVIEIVLLGFWWALGGGEQLGAVIKKILFLGFWLWLTTSFQSTSKAFVDSLIKAGLIAGGNPGGESLLLDPSKIAGYGLHATEALTQALDNIGFDVVDALIFGLAYIAIMVSFLVMAIQVFLAVLEYYLLTAVVGILIPFGILPQTKFLAEKAIGAIVSAGIKLMVLAFIMAVTEPVLSTIRFSGTEIKLNELWSVLLTCGGIAVLTWSAPGLAAGLLAGAPSLGAAAMTQSVSAGMMMGASATGGVVGATRAAAGAATGAVGIGAKAAGVVSAGALAGGTAAGGGGVAGAVVGAGRAAGQAAMGMAGGALRKIVSPVVDNFRAGARSVGEGSLGAGAGGSAAPGPSATGSPPAWANAAKEGLRDSSKAARS